MKQTILTFILGIGLSCLTAMGLWAQTPTTLVVEPVEGNETVIDVRNIASMTFANGKVMFALQNEKTQSLSFDYAKLNKLYFSTSKQPNATKPVTAAFGNYTFHVTQNTLAVNWSGNEPSVNAALYTMSGNLVYAEPNYRPMQSINVEALPCGTYLLKLNNQTFKIIKP